MSYAVFGKKGKQKKKLGRFKTRKKAETFIGLDMMDFENDGVKYIIKKGRY